MHTDVLGDIITVVTRKSDHQQGAWILTGDIRVRFPSSRASISAYNQQRAQHNNRDPKAERLLTYGGQISPTLIPLYHINEALEDASLHRLHVSSASFRGIDGVGLLRISRDNVGKTYENILALDTADDFQVPKDLFSAFNEGVEIAGEEARVELDMGTQLYLFEFSKITKTRGINNPSVTMEWPGIHIPQAIANNLLDKFLKCTFTTVTGDSEEHLLTLYERKPAGRGLDFTNNPDSKEDFLMYAVKLRCMNPVADTKKPLPPLEDLT